MKTHGDTLSDTLEHERMAFKSEMKTIKSEADQLCQMTLIHKETLLKYDKKIKENSYKALNATKKLQIQETKTEQIQKEINDLKKAYFFSLDLKSHQERHLRYFTQFYEFLNSVILYSEEFAEISDLIKRAEALENLKSELKERELESLEIIEDLCRSAQFLRITKSDKLLFSFNSLNRLEICSGEIQAKKLENVIRYSAKQRAIICQRKSFCILKMAIFNLFNQLNHQDRKVPPTSTGNALAFIKNYIADMEKVAVLLAQDHQHSSSTSK